jgi:exodeoxyribonuclease VII large subunit
LKDDTSQVQAVMWSTRNKTLLFTPEDGMQVVVKGRISVFGAKGTYQVEVWEMQPQGEGELRLRFEKLKRKLHDEGLFDEELKKPLPQYPENAAVITSRTGAVLQDFINIIKRRFPVLGVYLFPVNVQGPGAADEVIKALKHVETLGKSGKIDSIDVIVIARGGGSLEDLWPFNEERLARAIHSCKIPVVSAIGHEIDYTICDLVADLRAPTPSAAAELITPNINDLIVNLSKFSYFYKSVVETKLQSLTKSVKEIEGSYYFNRPRDLVYNFYQRLDELSRLMTNLTKNRLVNIRSRLKSFSQTLHHISPQNTLKKGFALVYKKKTDPGLFDSDLEAEKSNLLISRSAQLKKHDDVEINFFDNKKDARITK